MLAGLVIGFFVWAALSFFEGHTVKSLVYGDAENFKQSLLNLGPWAWIGFAVLVVMEVLISIIPGWIVYPVGAGLFGFPATVLLVLIGNFLGGSLCFWIGKKWGLNLLRKFIPEEKITKWEAYMEKRGALSLFFLKLNPLTSLDIWNYLAGASPLKFWKFTLANLLGIFPLVVASAYLGKESLELAPWMMVVFGLIAVFYITWFIWSLRKIRAN